MTKFHFYHSVEVRYDDIDPWWHVNNARFVSYLGLARLAYFKRLGLWDGRDYRSLPFVVADIHISYLKPIYPETSVLVGVRASRVGNKSLHLEQQIEDSQTREVKATAKVVVACFDYVSQSTAPVPDDIRRKINEFEGEIKKQESGIRD